MITARRGNFFPQKRNFLVHRPLQGPASTLLIFLYNCDGIKDTLESITKNILRRKPMSEEHFLPPRAGKGILPRARVNAILDAAKERGGHWVYVGVFTKYNIQTQICYTIIVL